MPSTIFALIDRRTATPSKERIFYVGSADHTPAQCLLNVVQKCFDPDDPDVPPAKFVDWIWSIGIDACWDIEIIQTDDIKIPSIGLAEDDCRRELIARGYDVHCNRRPANTHLRFLVGQYDDCDSDVDDDDEFGVRAAIDSLVGRLDTTKDRSAMDDALYVFKKDATRNRRALLALSEQNDRLRYHNRGLNRRERMHQAKDVAAERLIAALNDYNHNQW